MKLLRRLLIVALAVVVVVVAIAGILVVRRLASIPPAGPSGTVTPGTWTNKFDFGGTTRTYVLHIPAGLDATRPVPLLIELHGAPFAAARLGSLSRTLLHFPVAGR